MASGSWSIFVIGHLDVGSMPAKHWGPSGSGVGRGTAVVVIVVAEVEASELSPGAAQSGGGSRAVVRCSQAPRWGQTK
jgi:hypothetical protein